MTGTIGNFSLSAAVLVPLLTLLVLLAAGKFNSASLIRAARWFIVADFILLSLCSGSLLMALLQSDFSLKYVASYSERAMPFGYKLAAFWAGQEGSLLLWAWLLAAMSAVAVFTTRPRPGEESTLESAAMIATLAVICGFFAALMLFAANPFAVAPVLQADGHGLNPMLQDPAMIAHPPMLFLGYAGYAIPFAIMVGALVAGRGDNEWVQSTRRWLLVSWLFLSIGILLGAWWAYVELGWGGYWAWDPVENASLLPWLTGTALLHSIMVQQHRGMFKKWNAWLIAATFILCIFGSYITRSGVVESVHSFGKSLIGTFFFWFLVLLVAFSAALIAIRNRALKAENPLDGLVGKEGFFLATNMLLVGMTVITLVGTMFPAITLLMADQQVTVSPSFYNKVVAPLGLLLVALMAVGPLLVYGKDALLRLVRGAIIPVAVANVTIIAFAISGVHNGWALVAAGIAACALSSVVYDLVWSVIVRTRSHQESLLTALVRLLDNNHRRYGGQIVHVGMVLIVVGITASSVYEQKTTFAMKPGDKVEFGGRQLELTAVEEVSGANYAALQATLTMTELNSATPDDPSDIIAGSERTLIPQMRQYNKWEEQWNSEVSINSSWREDVYVSLAARDATGGVTIQAIVNPLVSWIWAGSVVLTLGGLVSLLPRLIPGAAAATVEAARDQKAPGPKPRGASGRVGVQVSA